MFIPLTVGGGINEVADFDRVLKCGADKVSVNSGAIRDPSLIPAAAKRYGDQCVVLSADVKRVDGQFRLFAKGGRVDTGMDALEWIKKGAENGAGESMGGYGALKIGRRRPERFGTIAALSGVLDFRRFVDEARAGMLPEIEPGEFDALFPTCSAFPGSWRPRCRRH